MSTGTVKSQERNTLLMMWRIRLFEEAVEELYARGLMHGTMHLSIGQEAVPTGACQNLLPNDQITSTHRGHGHCIARGADLNRAMAELLARDEGLCRGRGGSMHIADVSTGNLGANGIVGGGLPIATGAALANRLRGTTNVALCFHGDGAVGEGAWHEAMTLSAMWSLPVIFLCENNMYGMSMPARLAYRGRPIGEKATAYGIGGETVDGNDVDAVREAVGRAVARARAGDGPTLIEAKTYRWRGHSKSDKNLYRTKEEIAEWRKKCPIARYTTKLLDLEILCKDEVDQIEADAREEIRAAVTFAMQGTEPTITDMLAGVYAPSPVDASSKGWQPCREQ